MDCNNYSYAPTMLEDSKPYIEHYENDDMSADIEEYNGFNVWAGSYDGTLDVCEFYRTLEAAHFLYNAIVENFSDSAPTKKQIRALINQAKRIDKEALQC